MNGNLKIGVVFGLIGLIAGVFLTSDYAKREQLKLEGRAYAQAYIPPTGAQAVIPYASSSANFPISIQSPLSTLAGAASPGVPVVVISAPPVSVGSVVVNATALQFIAPTGAYSAVPVSILSQLPVNVAATAVQAVYASATVPVSFPTFTALEPTVYVTGVPAPVGTTWVSNGTGSPVPVNAGFATVYVTGVPAAPAAAGTVWISNGTASPVPVAISAVPTVYVTGVVPPVATMFINNPTASPVNAWVANPIATMFIANPTASAVNVFTVNTPAIQGTVSVLNSPGVVVFPATPLLSSSTATNTVMPNSMITANALPVLGLGYDATSAKNAYRAISVDANGNQNVNIQTPLMTQPVSLPTQAVMIWPSPANPLQTQPVSLPTQAVMIWPSPANPLQTQPVSLPTIGVQGFNTMAVMIWPSPANPLQTQPVSLPASLPTEQLATADPCMNPGIAKSFATIGLATATTGINQYQRIVTGSGALKVYVCGCWFGMQATAAAPFPQVQFIQSTPTATTGGVQCTATATAILSGQFTGSGAAGNNYNIGSGNSQVMSVAAGDSLCIIATPNANLNVGGVCSYIQQ